MHPIRCLNEQGFVCGADTLPKQTRRVLETRAKQASAVLQGSSNLRTTLTRVVTGPVGAEARQLSGTHADLLTRDHRCRAHQSRPTQSAAAAGKIVLCEIAAAVSGLKVQGKCCNIKPKANR